MPSSSYRTSARRSPRSTSRRCSTWSGASRTGCAKRCVSPALLTPHAELTDVSQAIEAENKLNAKLDILTRLQAAKTPGRGANRKISLTPSTAYDDSDDGEAGEGEEEEEEEVEKMLLSASRGPDTSFAESSVRTKTLCALR